MGKRGALIPLRRPNLCVSVGSGENWARVKIRLCSREVCGIRRRNLEKAMNPQARSGLVAPATCCATRLAGIRPENTLGDTAVLFLKIFLL